EIIIAGMGGELIARILGEWPYSRDPGRRFLLQPMTKSEVLRQFLSEEGFRIEEEQAVCEGERVYTVLAVRFVGRDGISPGEKTPCYYHFGKHPGSAARASALWIERERLRLLRRRDGLVASGKEPDPVLLSLIAAADAALVGFQEE
ncbi:MAG: SAM-dependent methyltransferase, partial [Ruminococcaceae bacterium]|nr:SAM-dependent methyltransferase [Oscillospiraceae bacterium]